MSSEHEIIFQQSLQKRKSIKYLKLVLLMDGILIYYQKLFPSSQIVTLDLDEKG